MGNDDILIPGIPTEESAPVVTPEEYLKISKALSEINVLGYLAIARDNLDVYSKKSVKKLIDEKVHEIVHDFFDKIESLRAVINENESLNQDFHEHLTSELENFSTKEENKKLEDDLKSFIKNKLSAYLTSAQIDDRIILSLVGYAENSQVYKRDELYTKKEIDRTYVKMDGSTPFTATLVGVYPKFRKDLATKGYADDCIRNHKEEDDPHHFISRINDKLKNYYKKSEVYTKAQTYDRTAIDSMVDKLVREACDSLIEEHINITPHLTSQDILRIIKNYSNENLLNKEEYEKASESILDSIDSKLSNVVWKTSGPVESCVGFVEDNSVLQSELTLQEIMDAIFYGKAVSVTVPDYVEVGNLCDITICIHGSIASVDYAELWQGDQLIQDWSGAELKVFDEGCITIQSDKIFEDTEFIFKVHYTNDTTYESSNIAKISYPIFVGLFPYWQSGTNVTWDYLKRLKSLDSKNNEFFDYSNKIIIIDYLFIMQDGESKKPVVIIPDSWEYELDTMSTKSQSFEIDSFDIVTLPMQIDGKTVIYKIYIFKQPQAFANLKVTFNFKLKK